MKKTLVSALVLSAISAGATAGVKVDVYNESSMEGERASTQGVVVGFDSETSMGTAFSAIEVTTKKDVEIGAGFVFDVTDNFYLKPAVSYVAKAGDKAKNAKTSVKGADASVLGKEYDGYLVDMDAEFKATGLSSDVAKVGLEGGYNFDNGFFVAARYRLDMETNTPKAKLNMRGEFYPDGGEGGFTESKSFNLGKGEKSTIGRTDLTAGYNFDVVTVTAKAIHKAELNKKAGDFSRWGSELKATVTAFDGVQPYLQVSSGHTHRKGFDENKIKLGTAFTF